MLVSQTMRKNSWAILYLVNKDPYGEGWLIKVKPEDIKAVEDLLDAEAYKAVVNG